MQVGLKRVIGSCLYGSPTCNLATMKLRIRIQATGRRVEECRVAARYTPSSSYMIGIGHVLDPSALYQEIVMLVWLRGQEWPKWQLY